jgi:hypothetical protein
MGLFLCPLPSKSKKLQKSPKNSKNINRLFSARYKKSDFLLHFFCQNIWSYQKFVVPLHPLSLKNGAHPKRAQAKQ